MIVIVDSGSTKCDWLVVDAKGNNLTDKVRTKGLNPAILSKEELVNRIQESEYLISNASSVKKLFFYGAGCGTQKPKKQLEEVLSTIFINAVVEVEEDTLAAIRSTINHPLEKAVVCIMGTGSNCSYYDGENLHQRVISLGYTLMDEASGNYYGKELIRDYYFKVMPQELRTKFEDNYNVDPDFIKANLYKAENPNTYLASFAEFLFLEKNNLYLNGLIRKGFKVFLEHMILQFKEELLQGIPIHFAGSIAFFAKDVITEVCKEYNLSVGNFVRRPIEGLVNYHI